MKNSKVQLNKFIDCLPGFIAVLLWSTGAYFIYHIKHVPVCQILVFGQLLGGFISIYIEKHHISLHHISNRIKKGWPALAVFWISQYGYIYAFQNAPPAQIDLIFYTWPAMLIIAKSWHISHKLNKWDWAGILFGFFGIFILLFPDLSHDAISIHYIKGYIGGALGAIGWVCYLLSTDKKGCEKTGFSAIGEDILILGIINLSVLILTNQWIEPTPHDWALLIIYAVAMFGIPYYLWRKTLEISPKIAGALSNMTPVLSILWLILAGITAFTTELIFALIMVKAAIYCIDRSQPIKIIVKID